MENVERMPDLVLEFKYMFIQGHKRWSAFELPVWGILRSTK
jgi:hypothetical protein